ncbi:MAG: ABC transporter ATP-binding protein, partial [Maricaulaceae bacterium]
RVRAGGIDLARDWRGARKRVGAVGQTPPINTHLTGRRNLLITRDLIGAPKYAVDAALDLVDLSQAADRRAGGYSLGMRQRLGIARALMGEPDLLILDEPTNGLDPAGIRQMRDFIRDLPARTGATVFVSSHLILEVQEMAEHVVLMHQGRVIHQGAVKALRAAGGGAIRIRVDAPERALNALHAAGFAAAPGAQAHALRVEPQGAEPPDETAAQANRLLVQAGVQVSELSTTASSLEDVFLTLTDTAVT